MKKLKKALLLLLCMVLAVGGSILGTLAYLTDTETVTNTFSVGDIRIALDEAKVTPDGVPVQGADRVQANEYHLLPGLTYTKDPVLTVEGGSEACYIYIRVDNGILELETEGDTSIAAQITANGWEELDGVENVYYKSHSQSATDTKYAVFESFTIDGDKVDNTMLSTYQGATVTVTGYAVQKDGFGSAKAAWDAADFPENADADAVVVTTTEEFTEAYKAGGSIKLGNDIGFSQTFDPNTATSDVVLDLNGHKLTVTNTYNNEPGVFNVCRNMTIMDSQGGGKLDPANIWAQDGEIRITGGTYDGDLAGSPTGSYTITGGTFYSYYISSATITGGKFKSDPTRFVNLDTHTVTNSDGWYIVTAK